MPIGGMEWEYILSITEVKSSTGNYASFVGCTSSEFSPTISHGGAIKFEFTEPVELQILKDERLNLGGDVRLYLYFTISTAMNVMYDIYASTANYSNYTHPPDPSVYSKVGSFDGGAGADVYTPITLPQSIINELASATKIYFLIVPSVSGSSIRIRSVNSGTSCNSRTEPALRLASSKRRVDLKTHQLWYTTGSAPSTQQLVFTNSSYMSASFIITAIPKFATSITEFILEYYLYIPIYYHYSTTAVAYKVWLTDSPYYTSQEIVSGAKGHYLGSYTPWNPTSTYDAWFVCAIDKDNTAAIAYLHQSWHYSGIMVAAVTSTGNYTTFRLANYS